MNLLDIWFCGYIPSRIKVLAVLLSPFYFFCERCRDFFDCCTSICFITKNIDEIFDQKVEEMKQRIAGDETISNDDLEKAFKDGLEEIRKTVTADIKKNIKKTVEDLRKKYGNNFPAISFKNFDNL